MTISTTLLFSRAVDLMGQQQSSLAALQEKVATGKELVRPSDSPDLAVNISRIKASIDELDAYKNSLNSVNDRLNIEESYIGSAKDVLIRLKQLTLQGANGTMSSSDRDVIALEVDELISYLVDLACPIRLTPKILMELFVIRAITFGRISTTRRIAGHRLAGMVWTYSSRCCLAVPLIQSLVCMTLTCQEPWSLTIPTPWL
jgi:hypothetical protein